MTDKPLKCPHGYSYFCPEKDCIDGHRPQPEVPGFESIEEYFQHRMSTPGNPETPFIPPEWIHIPDAPIYSKGEPCGHSGCLQHVTHPCEECGRIAGEPVYMFTARQLYALVIDILGLGWEYTAQHGYTEGDAKHAVACDTIQGLDAELAWHKEIDQITSQLNVRQVMSQAHKESVSKAARLYADLTLAIKRNLSPEQAAIIAEDFATIINQHGTNEG